MSARTDALACLVRVGRLDVVRCRELGVPYGSRLAQLKEGAPVLSDDGVEVLPSQVCCRRLQCLSDACDMDSLDVTELT